MELSRRRSFVWPVGPRSGGAINYNLSPEAQPPPSDAIASIVRNVVWRTRSQGVRLGLQWIGGRFEEEVCSSALFRELEFTIIHWILISVIGASHGLLRLLIILGGVSEPPGGFS